MAPKDINQDQFEEEVIQHKGVVFVDFHAEWCGPCKMTEPIIEDLATNSDYKDKVKFVKVDVDQNQDLAAQFSVFSIPTFITFKDGEPVGQFAGARDRGGFEAELNKVV
ncbi:thioredoxin [Candidatus Woesebacteria bacterium]|jgi:thioredoxin 1|nr:thioredoxin [Candidatus Woesebacteria bacterium]